MDFSCCTCSGPRKRPKKKLKITHGKRIIKKHTCTCDNIYDLKLINTIINNNK